MTAPEDSIAGAIGKERFAGEGAGARVSALIVNFNTRDRVLCCLAALRRARVVGGLQVVVVDNASADDSAGAIRGRYPDAELIANTENRGYAAANNQAFARASTPYVLILNPDTEVEPDAVEQMAAFLGTHPEVVAVTGNLVSADGTPRPYLHEFPKPLTLLLIGTPLGKLLPSLCERRSADYHLKGRLPETPAPVPQPPGACLMVRRAALDGMLFDEQFPLFFNDVDLCWRLQQRGSIYFLPQARVLHEQGEGGLKRAPETILLEGAVSAVRYFRKHHGPLPATFLFLGYLGDLIYRFLLGTTARAIGHPGNRVPFSGTLRQNLARLARYVCGISYFERRAQARSAWRRFLLRALEADLWSG